MSTDEMIEEGRKTAFASRDSVKRTLALSEQTINVGENILGSLSRQDSQMQRAQDDLDRVDEVQDATERQLRVVNSFGDQLLVGITSSSIQARNSNNALDKELKKDSKKREKKKSPSRWSRFFSRPESARPPTDTPPEVRVLGEEAVAAIQETDTGLDHISKNVKVLKEIAIDMGERVTDQNKRLEKLNERALYSDIRTRELSHRTDRYIK